MTAESNVNNHEAYIKTFRTFETELNDTYARFSERKEADPAYGPYENVIEAHGLAEGRANFRDNGLKFNMGKWALQDVLKAHKAGTLYPPLSVRTVAVIEVVFEGFDNPRWPSGASINAAVSDVFSDLVRYSIFSAVAE